MSAYEINKCDLIENNICIYGRCIIWSCCSLQPHQHQSYFYINMYIGRHVIDVSFEITATCKFINIHRLSKEINYVWIVPATSKAQVQPLPLPIQPPQF